MSNLSLFEKLVKYPCNWYIFMFYYFSLECNSEFHLVVSFHIIIL